MRIWRAIILYRIVEASGKIMCYWNLGWIGNGTAVKEKIRSRTTFYSSKASTGRFYSRSGHCETWKLATFQSKTPVFTDFQPFKAKLTQDFPYISRNSLSSRSDSIISSALSSSESLDSQSHKVNKSGPQLMQSTYWNPQLPSPCCIRQISPPISTPQFLGFLSAATISGPT